MTWRSEAETAGFGGSGGGVGAGAGGVGAGVGAVAAGVGAGGGGVVLGCFLAQPAPATARATTIDSAMMRGLHFIWRPPPCVERDRAKILKTRSSVAPSRSVTHRPYPPSRSDANTRWRPSADQRGFSLFPPVTTGLAPVPSARQVQMSNPPPTRVTNAIRSPFGDHDGESV